MMTTLATIADSLPALRMPGRKHVLDAVLDGINANTRRAYAGDLRDFAAYVGTDDPRRAVDALLRLGRGEANGVALGYRNHLAGRGLSPATVGRRLSAVRKVVQVARILGDVDWTIEVESPRGEGYRDTRGPGADGWRSMLREVQRRADEGDVRAIRDLAIVRLLHDLGLRRGELCALDYESIDQERGTVAVVGKGRKQARDLTLPGPTVDALADWLAIRGTGPGPLFTRLDNAGAGTGRLTGEAVRLIVKGLGLEAGLERAVRPHGLRHQAITAALESGHKLESVMKFARHSNPRTTMIYDDNRSDVAGMVARTIARD